MYNFKIRIMKRLFLATVGVLLCVICLAQDGNAKKTLLVDYFTYTKSIGDSYPTMLRNAIIGALQETGRLNIIDASLESSLQLEEERRSSEAAISDDKARNEEIRKLGADYMMRIHVATMSGVRKTLDDGSVYYDGLINFTLTVLNVADGTVKVSKPFTYSGLNAKTGDTPEAAVLATTDYVKISMTKFMNENFKVESMIVQIENCGKKGAETVYINCGSAAGIEKGQLFDVFLVKEVAGKKLKTKIGELKAEEVQAEDMTLCKVLKGGAEIKKASDEQKELPVLSGKKRGTGWGAVGTFLK